MAPSENSSDRGIEASDSGSGAESARVLMRNYFSTYFLWTAQHLSALAGSIEAHHADEPRFDLEHRGLVLSSLLGSAGFLEAMVNELYQDAFDSHGVDQDGYIAPLSPEVRHRMKELWRATDHGRRIRPLEKYQLLLTFADRDPLERDAQPYADANFLFQLRNALAHYQPEDLSADESHKTESRLKGKFPDNALMGGSKNPWWPDHCLGHGCSEWAHKTAKSFADRVADDLGIRPNYRRHEEGGWFEGTGQTQLSK